MAFRFPVAFIIKQDDPELKEEHEQLMKALFEMHVDVFETYGEGKDIKVNDVAFIVNGTALMCTPTKNNSLNSINLMRSALKTHVSIRIAELNIEGAKLKGSDVLFTGQEIVVGLSEDTNEYGAQAVAKTFPEYSTYVVKLREPFKSLRQVISVIGNNVLAVSDDPVSKKIMQDLGQLSSCTYKVLQLPEKTAVDAIYCNKCLLTHDPSVIPNSNVLFESKIDYSRFTVSAQKHLKRNHSLTDRILFVCPAGSQKNIASTLP